ncbi:MAG: hypothetical protein GOP50_05570 [Candidatus Heimdallarchaeota archaeon]|nr:hypothetical protein [Candidatus Heimdallarchaeota archaeon]
MNSKVAMKISTLIISSLLILQSSIGLSYLQIEGFCYQDLSKEVEYDQINSGRFEGYNLYTVQRYDSDTWKQINRTLVISDLSGNIYFSKEIPVNSAGLNNAEFINSTTILYGDKNGAYLWNFETDVSNDLNFNGHHEYERNYANNTYFSLSVEPIEIDGASYLFDRIIEYDEDGEEVWSVSTSSFVSHTHWCPYEDMSGSNRDLTHSNTVFYDDAEDVIYINVRNTNTFYKIDHKTGEPIWGLGEFGNFTLFDINGNERDILFYHTHGLEKISANKFSVFDNDEHNQTDGTNHRSRLLEITIDEDKMYANVSWEWISPVDYYSGWFGDCDLLPNNNYLGVFGAQTRPDTTYGARLVEVNTEGEIVWEYSYERAGSDTFGIYRVERFRFEPIVSEPTYYSLGENDSYLEWDVRYNFRAKTEFEGQYFISLDNSLVENGTIELPRFWKSTKVRHNISPTDYAEHKVSLVISDEAGHLSNETDRYEPIGTISHESVGRIGLVLGLSLGLGIPSLSGIIAVIWKRLSPHKSFFKKKE